MDAGGKRKAPRPALDRRGVRKGGEEAGRRRAVGWEGKVGEELGEGRQHEGALAQPGMGNRQFGSAALAVGAEQQIDVEDARRPPLAAPPAGPVLDGLGQGDDRLGGESRAAGGDGVQISGLG